MTVPDPQPQQPDEASDTDEDLGETAGADRPEAHDEDEDPPDAAPAPDLRPGGEAAGSGGGPSPETPGRSGRRQDEH